MRLDRALFWSTALAIGCCTSLTLALPNIFRRQASDSRSDASTRSEVELLNLDPVDQVAIFGDASECEIAIARSDSHTTIADLFMELIALAYLEAPKGQACYSHIYDQVKAGCVRDSDMNSDERMLGEWPLTQHADSDLPLTWLRMLQRRCS